MSPATTVDSIIDNSPFGVFQLRVLLLCTLIAVIDGFDVTAMAAVAPRVATDWGVAPGALGPALSASLVGLAIGGALGGPLGDRFGRRPVLVMMFLIGVLATTATALAGDLVQLVFWRFVTGLGLGGTIPLGAALTAEYMPKRLRTFLVVLMFSGHPLGGALANFVAPSIIATFDWHHVFYVGGVLPLIAGAGLWIWLPESPTFVERKLGPAALARLMAVVDPSRSIDHLGAIGNVDSSREHFSVGEVFRDGRGAMTIILWGVFFATQMNMFILSSWLPVLFSQAGVPLAMALYASTAYQLGGSIGSIGFGAISDRFPPTLVLAAMYAMAVIATLSLAGLTVAGGALFVASLLAGLGAIGAQLCLNAWTAMLYPAHIRATGLGWALSVGRIGAILGPLVAGGLMLRGWTSSELLQTCAVLPVMAAIGVLVLRRRGVDTLPTTPILTH